MLIIALLLIGVCVVIFVGLFLPKILSGIFNKYQQLQHRQVERTQAALEGVFVSFKPAQLRNWYLIGMIGLGLIGFLLQGVLGLIIGVAASFVLPSFAVKIISEKRRKQFLDQLVDTLNILSSSLKAGLTLPQALEVVVEEMPSPTKEEFALILQQMRMGVPLEEAFTKLRERIKDEDVDIVVISVLVARDTGGNVTHVFSNLTNMIREKKKIARRVKVLTVQARFQGLIISAMPVLFVPFVLSQNPHHFDVFFADSTGQMLLVYAVVSEILGIIAMKMLSKVEV